MAQTRVRQISGVMMLALSAWAQQPDAQHTREELSHLLDGYPPALRAVLGLDPSLLSNQAYLTPYPALVTYLAAHPEIPRNPSFYVKTNADEHLPRPDRSTRAMEMWTDVLGGLAGLTAFAMAIGLLTWVIRSVIDYRRWNRLTKVQTDVHTKLVDRFTANEDLLAYIQSPAGAKFLESSPITLDAGPRTISAPLGRILWSVQAGLVVTALGIGLQVVGARISDDSDVTAPLRVLGVLGIAVGLGFLASAIISFVISHRLGLIEPPAPRSEPPGARQ